MKITVKILQGVECCVEISEDQTTDDLKVAVEGELKIPVENQKLVLKGKTLQSSTSLRDYKLKDGDKVHLVVKTPALAAVEPISAVIPDNPRAKLENHLKRVIKQHFRSEEESNRVVAATLKGLDRRLSSLSLDDIERICAGWDRDKKLNF